MRASGPRAPQGALGGAGIVLFFAGAEAESRLRGSCSERRGCLAGLLRGFLALAWGRLGSGRHPFPCLSLSGAVISPEPLGCSPEWGLHVGVCTGAGVGAGPGTVSGGARVATHLGGRVMSLGVSAGWEWWVRL